VFQECAHHWQRAVSSVDCSLARNKQENRPTLDDRPIADAGKEKRKTPRSCGDGADRPLLLSLLAACRCRILVVKVKILVIFAVFSPDVILKS
jgi:hypothetical protein